MSKVDVYKLFQEFFQKEFYNDNEQSKFFYNDLKMAFVKGYEVKK